MSRHQEKDEDEIATVPLFSRFFPLLPGAVEPIFWFQSRGPLKELMLDCREDDRPLGVVWARDSSACPPVLAEMGTMARIDQQEPWVHGQRRFRVLEIHKEGRYPMARVALLRADSGWAESAMVREARLEYAALLVLLSTVAGAAPDEVPVPEDAEMFSFAIAHRLASGKGVSPLTLQGWLEAPSVPERLAQLLPMLRDLREAMAREVLRRGP